MCETCNGNGVLYKDIGMGIEIIPCPDCETEKDACAELREKIEQFRRRD